MLSNIYNSSFEPFLKVLLLESVKIVEKRKKEKKKTKTQLFEMVSVLFCYNLVISH